MAEESSLEKKHQATAKRITELRKQGQSLRSRDLTSGLVFISGVIALLFISNQLRIRIQDNFISAFKQIGQIVINDSLPYEFIRNVFMDNIVTLFPLFLATVLAAILSPFIFGGWNFSFHSVQFNFEKLNPITNLKNIFSKRIFLNVFKSLYKVVLIISILVFYIYDKQYDIVKLATLNLYPAMYGSYTIVSTYIYIISSSLIIIIISDVVISYFEYLHKSKMTTQELKDESKETEGNADVKRRIRSSQMALMKQRLSVTIPRANVVITNPTHYAVAIKYDPNKDKAPKVIAKGKGYIAQQIRRISAVHGITIYEAPVLARAVYNTSKIGSEIRPELYMAVAIVLSYVHQLKNYQQGVGHLPQIISDLQIPKEFIYHE